MTTETDPQDSFSDDARFERGAALRGKVLGAEHLARNGAAAPTDATAMQRLITEIGWGTIWPRGVLELKTRSMITVAMLIALNRPHELATHLRGAVNNGATETEIRELVIHSILYCGFPAAIDAMGVVDEVLAEGPSDAS